MFHRSVLLTILLPAAACSIPAQEPRPERVILKNEVDGLVRALRQAARPGGALGDGSCRQTAMVLAAAGHCHRYYHIGDGPWIRRAVGSLFVGRRGDGAFADGPDDDGVLTTRWVLAALQVIDPDSYPNEIETGRRFVAARDAGGADPLEERVAALRREVRGAADRAAALEEKGRGALPRAPGGPFDPAAAAEQLVHVVSCQAAARAEVTPPEKPAPDQPWRDVQERGFAFLLTQQKDGVFGIEFDGQMHPDVGLTGIGLAALQTKPRTRRKPAEQAVIDAGLRWLLAQQHAEEGSFGQTNVNYSTCAAVMALASAGDPRFKDALERAQKYVLALQNVEERDYARSDRDYGSIGYGGDERGDLSNLQFALEALRSTGLDENHEAFAKALVFLQRTQNLQKYNDYTGRSREGGTWREVAPGNDGGAAYYPGNSPAGYLELPDGTRIPRSYGSMTYALLKAYTLCGLPRDDPRVQAAVAWIQKNWTLDVNPGVDPVLGADAAYQGLYYYYMVLAQALATAGLDTLEVPATADVDWRATLAEHLTRLQRANGSWLNSRNARWWENQPLVCTVYALLALQHCTRPPRVHDDR